MGSRINLCRPYTTKFEHLLISCQLQCIAKIVLGHFWIEVPERLLQSATVRAQLRFRPYGK